MNTSLFLARLLGLYMVILSFPMLFTPAAYRERYESFVNNSGEMLFAGMITLLAGLACVILHNVWIDNWHLVITLIGWVAVLDGISMIYFPEQTRSLFKKLGRRIPCIITGMVYLLLGLFLTMKGYF